MPRREFPRKVRRAAIERAAGIVQIVQCTHCKTSFDRGYRISTKRASRPQYCSPECRAAEIRLQAESVLATSFWNRTERQPNGCLHWMGRLDGKGYGRVDHLGIPRLAHRYAYQLAFGSDPGNSYVCHSCDNPQCVEPRHLWLGTQSENMSDAANKGRLNPSPVFGSANPSSRLTEEQARRIKLGDEPASTIAARFGVSRETVYAIRKGRNWGWL